MSDNANGSGGVSGQTLYVTFTRVPIRQASATNSPAVSATIELDNLSELNLLVHEAVKALDAHGRVY
jgi:hypothetical protein